MRSAIEREKRLARGIVIRHGAFTPEPAAFWAYLWSEDAETDEVHWHQRVPVGRRSDEHPEGHAA